VIILFLSLFFHLSLALDDQRAVLDLDLDILLLDAGNFGRENKLVLIFINIDRRSPRTRDKILILAAVVTASSNKRFILSLE